MVYKVFWVLIIAVVYCISATSSVSALTSTGIPSREVKKEAKITKIQEKMERKAVRTAALDERKKKILERVQTHRAKVFDRSEKAVVRLDALWKRVESRIEKIQSRGGDVSSLDDERVTVREKRAAAMEAIRLAKDAYTGDTSLADIAADTATFRRGLTAVKTSLQAYHQSIIAVVRNLKTIKVPASPTPAA